MKHCYVRCTRKSVYSPFMQSTWPHPLSQRARWRPKRWKESSSRRFDGKERKDKCVYRSLVHKIEEKSDWKVFSVQLLCLPTCNYGYGSVSWTVNVGYIHGQLLQAITQYSILEAMKQILCRGMIPLSIDAKK